MGRAITVTAGLYIGYELFKNGMMTLSYPTTEKEQKLWELEGRQASSIKVGNKWRTGQTLGPLGNVLIVGGAFADAFKRTGSATQAMVEAMTSGAKSFTENTFLKGVSSAVDAITDPKRSFEVWFTNTAGSTVPTIISDLANSIDTVNRRYKGPLEKIQSRIPFWRQDLDPKIDVLGGEVSRYGGNPLEAFIDPTRPSKEIQTPVINELRRLTDAGFNVSPSLLGDKNGYAVLSKEDNTELWKKAGTITDSKLQKLIELPQYKEMDDEKKAKTVENIISKSQVYARASMVLKLTEGLQGEQLKNKLSELKKGKLLTQDVFKAYQELR